MLQCLKMPEPFVVFGALLLLVGICYIVNCLRIGYLSSVSKTLWQCIYTHPLMVILFLVVILVEIRFIDLPLSRLCRAEFNQNVYRAFDFVNSMGEGWFIGGVIFTAILLYEFAGKTKPALVLRISLMALIYAGILNTILKCIFNRERPGISMNPWNFFHFFITGAKKYSELIYASNSMPSGHTIAIFAAITPILIYEKKSMYRMPIIAFAILICIARIYTINHWLSDVSVAGILGIIIGYACYIANSHRLH